MNLVEPSSVQERRRINRNEQSNPKRPFDSVWRCFSAQYVYLKPSEECKYTPALLSIQVSFYKLLRFIGLWLCLPLEKSFPIIPLCVLRNDAGELLCQGTKSILKAYSSCSCPAALRFGNWLCLRYVALRLQQVVYSLQSKTVSYVRHSCAFLCSCGFVNKWNLLCKVPSSVRCFEHLTETTNSARQTVYWRSFHPNQRFPL